MNRDWGVPVLYLRADGGQLFAGAADEKVRQQARESAEANVTVRLKEVQAGGEVKGADVRAMLSGKLLVQIIVSGAVFGSIVGADIGKQTAGTAQVDMDLDTVGAGGQVIGVRLDELGFDT